MKKSKAVSTQEPQKVFFVSLGCAKNRVDSEVMASLAQNGGFEIASAPEEADAIVVNTCGFILPAKEESVRTILEMAEYKQQGRAKRLIVTGCLSQRYKEELVNSLPEVDFFLGSGNIDEIAQALVSTKEERYRFAEPGFLPAKNTSRLNSLTPYSAYLKIAEGCSRKCSFCIIPSLRGPARSRPIADITAEAKMLAESGVIELNLVAQDLTAYGRDLTPQTSLYALLNALEEVKGIKWIRLLYAYPHRFDKRLIKKIASSEKVLSYIDLPLQHIDDAILKSMKRGIGERGIRELIAALRENIPNLTLRTTLIVGYPGETEAQFEKLCAFVAETRFDRLGVFAFFAEEGTEAAKMEGQIPKREKNRRRNEIMRLQKQISRDLNRKLIGSKIKVLVENSCDEEGFVYSGRAFSQAPEADGVCYIVDGFVRPGEITPLRVIKAEDYDLVCRSEPKE